MRKVRGIEIPDGKPFAEDFSYVRGEHLHFEVKSYNKWQESLFPDSTKKGFEVRIGKNGFYLQSRAIPVVIPRWTGWMFDWKRNGWERAQIEMPGNGSVSFDAQVNIVRLIRGSIERINNPQVWMSLTPGEVYSQRRGVARGKGNVLVLGLGMGWLARRVLERKKVKHVTVVEKDKDVLRYFGDLLKKDFGDRLTLIHGDAHYYGDPEENKGYDYDVALWDIWDHYGGVYHDNKFQAIRMLVPCWYWGTTST